MLDYKDIITKHYGLGMKGMAIAKTINASTSGVNDFLRAFKACEKLGHPLPQGITNYGTAEAVYGKSQGVAGRDLSYEQPDYEAVSKDMSSRKNMTLKVLWNRYVKKCRDSGLKFYSYRQFCENYAKWCEENKETLHFDAAIGQKMEANFAGKTFRMGDPLTGEVLEIVVFVVVPPYSQYIYAEGMLSTKEPQWIAVNNNALEYFGGVPALVVCDNCKQAVIANWDWIAPELNKDYAEWAEYNHIVILPAKVKKPKCKSSVENAVGTNTEAVIKHILASRKLEVQAYRMRQGVLSFTKKYSKQALEETCKQALELGKVNYTFIKNTIPVVAEDLGATGYNTSVNEARNKVEYHHCETLLETLVALKAQDYSRYQKRLKKICSAAFNNQKVSYKSE